MNCNQCPYNNGNGGKLNRPVIKHTQGNYLSLSIPLILRWHSVSDGVENIGEQGQLDTTMDIVVVLSRGKKEYRYKAEVYNNQVTIVDNGGLPLGTYDIIIVIKDGDNQLRYKQRTMLQVVDTTEAGQQYENDEINVVAVYPVVEGKTIAISIANGQVRITENGTYQGDDKPNNGRADITAKLGDGHLVIENGEAQLHI